MSSYSEYEEMIKEQSRQQKKYLSDVSNAAKTSLNLENKMSQQAKDVYAKALLSYLLKNR